MLQNFKVINKQTLTSLSPKTIIVLSLLSILLLFFAFKSWNEYKIHKINKFFEEFPTASGTTEQRVISWQDNSDNEAGFKIERRLESESIYTEISSLAANTATFTDSDILPEGDYCYRVIAHNSAGESESDDFCLYLSQDPASFVDTDLDGVPDHEDSDDDNDGVPDGEDAFPLDKERYSENDNTQQVLAVPYMTTNGSATIDFIADNTEKVVVNFTVDIDSDDTKIYEISFTSIGSLNEVNDISIAKLYYDANKNELADNDEFLAKSTFSKDDGEITFTLSTPQPLVSGENNLLMTYTF